MPKRPKRPCRFSGCPNLTDSKSGYCQDHDKQANTTYDKFIRGYRHSERYGACWKKIRDIYIRQNPLCELCRSKGKFVSAQLVHHIKPIAEGGTNVFDNLMALCVSCHEKIHKRGASRG